MHRPVVMLKRERHRENDVLSMYMPKDTRLNGTVKQLGARWSTSKKMWWLKFDRQVAGQAIKALQPYAYVDYTGLKSNKATAQTRQKPTPAPAVQFNEVQKQAMWAYADKLRIRKYSESTFRTYGVYFKQFLAAHPKSDPKDITEEQIIAHIIATVQRHNYATKTQNQIVNAVKFYYEQVLGLPKAKYWIPRPRKEFKLPVIASEEEIIRIIVAADNLKHQCIIAMLYSTGIRRGELINLKKADIDIHRKQVFVRGGKGKKDRTTILSDRMVNALLKYYEVYKPRTWVFQGVKEGPYSGTSVGKLLQRAVSKAGIEKKITPHVLRHSFATHLMDKGTDTRYIQELLGHKNLNTTAIYAHVSKKVLMAVTSPLDRIFDNNELKNKYLRNSKES